MKRVKVRIDRQTGEFVEHLTSDGMEIPDPVPLAPVVGFQREAPLHERIRAMVRHEYERVAALNEVETPEEADDFIIEDEEDARYGERFAVMPGHEHDWEESYEPPASFEEMKERLVKAGWKAPEKGQEAPAVKPKESSGEKEPLDAAPAPVQSSKPSPTA